MATMKIQGLQQKFEAATSKILEAETQPWQGPLIVEEIGKRAQEFQVTLEEIAELDKNTYNYLNRAVKSGIIVGHGRKSGYSLSGEPRAEPAPLETPGEPQESDDSKGMTFTESFTHFAATLALSERWNSRVLSLSNAGSPVKWGNPDMLMARYSDVRNLELRIGSDDIDTSIFNRVDATPEIILSSIELKYGMNRDRRKFFSALAEAAANSSWANESWLVFMDAKWVDEPLDPEITALANRMGVNVGEIMWDSDVLALYVHVAIDPRTVLRVSEIAQDRQALVKDAYHLLKLIDDEETYLQVDDDLHKSRVLLSQAFENLVKQRGFAGDEKLLQGLDDLANADKEKVFEPVVTASFALLMNVAGKDQTSKQFIETLDKAAREKLVLKQAHKKAISGN